MKIEPGTTVQVNIGMELLSVVVTSVNGDQFIGDAQNHRCLKTISFNQSQIVGVICN